LLCVWCGCVVCGGGGGGVGGGGGPAVATPYLPLDQSNYLLVFFCLSVSLQCVCVRVCACVCVSARVSMCEKDYKCMKKTPMCYTLFCK